MRNSLVSPSLEAGIINAKYTNAVPFYCIEKQFDSDGRDISRQEMARWSIACAERCLSYFMIISIKECMTTTSFMRMSARKMNLAYKALAMIQAIYNADNALKDLPPDERLIKRQTAVKPLVKAYFAWCHQYSNNVSSKGKTGNGISYSLNQERYLKVFLEYPDVPLDNNSAKRSIRNFCIGKKNFVMIDTVSGAKASAVIYILVETAKANNLNVYEYIKYLLAKIP